jgi:hypothetical protein
MAVKNDIGDAILAASTHLPTCMYEIEVRIEWLEISVYLHRPDGSQTDMDDGFMGVAEQVHAAAKMAREEMALADASDPKHKEHTP